MGSAYFRDSAYFRESTVYDFETLLRSFTMEKRVFGNAFNESFDLYLSLIRPVWKAPPTSKIFVCVSKLQLISYGVLESKLPLIWGSRSAFCVLWELEAFCTPVLNHQFLNSFCFLFAYFLNVFFVLKHSQHFRKVKFNRPLIGKEIEIDIFFSFSGGFARFQMSFWHFRMLELFFLPIMYFIFVKWKLTNALLWIF